MHRELQVAGGAMSQRQTLGELLSGLKNLKPSAARTVVAPASVPAGPVPRLLELLREFAGFRGNEHLQRKLAKVFEGMSPEQLEHWVTSLAADPSRQELLALVEDLTNHETYFFRDQPQLDMLSQHILPRLIREKVKSGDRTLRIWSAACATGEEAWTLLMLTLQALLDAGEAREQSPGEVVLGPGWRLDILGTDISRQAIRVARGASYRTESMASFRDFPPRYLRFFEPQVVDGSKAGGRLPGAGYRQLKAGLRRLPRFDLFNLVSPVPPVRGADLVVCRNVLIYIDPAAYGRIQRMLGEALRPGGFLLLGIVDRLHASDDFRDHWFGRSLIHERK
jgi:chemotaxis protein methyltransferase CheR